MADWQAQIDAYVDGIAGRLVDIRRYLHAHPEPSGEEHDTTIYLTGLLAAAKLHTHVAPGGRGLVAEPDSQSETLARVAIRGDIDALRLADEKDVPYRSTVEGVTHACGHDAHAAMVVGAALALAECSSSAPWPVAWRAILQPAEETSEGAKEIVEAGAVDNVSAIVGLHVDPERPTGCAAFGRGTLTAYCDEIDVVVRGSGGHAARPHHSTDPIIAAAQFLTSLYQLVPRAVDSRNPTVVTFGSIHGGAAQNVIPTEVVMRGTARTHCAEARDNLERKIEAIARGVGETTGTEISLAFKQGPDAVVNDPAVTETCERVAADVVGDEGVARIELPSMGGEDFSEYLAHAPGCFFRLGIADGNGTAHPLHSARFDLDENALVIGAKILARSVVMLSRPKG